MPTRRPPARRPVARVPVRRNRMAADLIEALDSAIMYAEEASRYARDKNRGDIEGYVADAIYSLNRAMSDVDYDDEDEDDYEDED